MGNTLRGPHDSSVQTGVRFHAASGSAARSVTGRSWPITVLRCVASFSARPRHQQLAALDPKRSSRAESGDLRFSGKRPFQITVRLSGGERSEPSAAGVCYMALCEDHGFSSTDYRSSHRA